MPDEVTLLPASLAAVLRPALPGLAVDTIGAIGAEIPEYRRPLEGPFGRALGIGVQRALERFVDLIERGGVDAHADEDPAAASIYVELGRGEQQAGRSLDALLGAYRLGARLAWERFVAVGEAAGEDPRHLYALAGEIFSYIDAISAESVDGFSREQARSESERARRRRALVRALDRPEVDLALVEEAAHEAGWTVPQAIAALVVAGRHDADRLASRLGLGVIAEGDGDRVVAFVPDPDAPGRAAQLLAGLPDGTAAAIGPTVPPVRAAHSSARARATLRLAADGRLPGAGDAAGAAGDADGRLPGAGDAGTAEREGGAAGPPDGRAAGGAPPAPRLVRADDHLVPLLLGAEEGALATDLAAQVLAPLEGLTPAARERTVQTLRIWLDHPGRVQRIAELLEIHPQTVRYRVARLYERFGEALDDPEHRFRLSLALRATTASHGQPNGPGHDPVTPWGSRAS